ncbi:ribonuclease P protein component [Varibaculum prostatecancerukia]|uniref:ribonuclease P protein component n=1 Tax=Varibaculum prostatecancerukia TaxID=2811781 RepID=UPI001C000F1D
MLPQANRLKKSADFSLVFRRGISVGNQLMVVHHLPDQFGTAAPLVGFVVPKRFLPRAVDRNRVKRRLRALSASRLENLGSGSLTVIRALGKSKNASYLQLGAALDQALSKVKQKGKK